MPQMAPLNWLTLMISFIIILITFNITIFFSSYNNFTVKTNNKSIIKMNWKW